MRMIEYRVRAVLDGVEILLSVSADERGRYACEPVREPANVSAVSVVGPLVMHGSPTARNARTGRPKTAWRRR